MITQAKTQPNLRELVKQGNPQVIAALLNRKLEPIDVTVKATFKESCLQLILESSKVPPQQTLVRWIKKQLLSFGETQIKTVKIYGRKAGEDFPNWQDNFTLIDSESIAQESIEDQISDSIVKAESNQITKTSDQKSSFFGSVFNSVSGAFVGAAETVGNVAAQASQNVAGVAVNTGGAINNATSKATEGMVYMLDLVNNSQMLQSLTKGLKIEWLLEPIDRIDIVKAETHVQNLKDCYPNEDPREISHRIMLEKAAYVGASGVATSIVPGVATAMIAVDIATTTALQAEMVYQIACVYGFYLEEPARKDEALAILGLAVGGGQAIKAGGKYTVKAGLGFLRNVPLAGAVIGASTNAVMLYAVGYAACRFYEAKLNPLTMEATLEAAQTESQHYLEAAITQEVIMDQILVHVILAGNPDKTWDEILLELKAANLSPASLELLQKNGNSLIPLEKLLNNISEDFAVPLLAQCKQIAQSDGIITPEEAKILQRINQKLNV